MGKGGRKGGGGGKASSEPGVCWSGADHAIHNEERRRKSEKKKAKKSREDVVSQKERRTLALTHGTGEKREGIRLNLHLTKTKRALTAMKERLESYDPVEEAEKEAAKRKAEAEKDDPEAQPPKKKGRKGPETWKLRGAARPAHEVYDFDVRYVDPHVEAHKKAAARAKRTKNLLAIFKGKFGSDEENVPSVCRDYLGLLMQMGHLSMEAKQFKTARASWLECIELEGDENDSPITSARESLMRMYLDLKRFDAALRLGGERLLKDTSVWVRYSTALVALSEETPNGKDRKKTPAKTSSTITPQVHLANAIKCNPLCAYYLAFYDIFKDVIEYAEDIAEADDGPQSSLEETIEYCSSPYALKWQGEPAKALRNALIEARSGTHDQLTANDVEWKNRLTALEQEFESRKNTETSQVGAAERDDNDGKDPEPSPSDGEDDDSDDVSQEGSGDEREPIDLGMYINMFRTAMEMVSEDGHL